MQPQFYTVEEAALYLKVSKMTIYRYIKSGKLPAYKVGSDYRIHTTDFVQFMMTLTDEHSTKHTKDFPS